MFGHYGNMVDCRMEGEEYGENRQEKEWKRNTMEESATGLVKPEQELLQVQFTWDIHHMDYPTFLHTVAPQDDQGCIHVVAAWPNHMQ